MDLLDWDSEEESAIELLRSLLRFDTSNPPGNERPCAEFLGEWLRESDLEPKILVPARGRANLISRLRGSGRGPLLLAAHLDVVPAEGHYWTHPPFGGEVHDGFIWGRGAIDMKHMAAMSAVVMRALARLKIPLRRDLIFAAVSDEEAGCDLGSAWLVYHHPDQVRAEYSLGEVGGSTHQVGNRFFYPVQVAEKGLCWIRVRASGGTGHGSMPRSDSAVLHLADFVQKAGALPMRLRSSPTAKAFLRELSLMKSPASRTIIPLAFYAQTSRYAVEWLVPDPANRKLADAAMRNTVSPTILAAGKKINVIPAEAWAEIDGRVAVGSSSDELLAELLERSGPDISLEVLKAHEPTVAPVDTPLMAHIRDVVAEHHPGARVVPSITPGFSDAAYWSRLGTKCYGFTPVRLRSAPEVAFEDLYHAHDERISLEGFRGGLRMLADVVFRHCLQ